jgi:hypothetical protein
LADQENDASMDEDQYLFVTMYNQELKFYPFCQETISNSQWYEKFNTKVDVGSAISINWQHKVLLEYVAQETHALAFTALLDKHKQAVCKDDKIHTASLTYIHVLSLCHLYSITSYLKNANKNFQKILFSCTLAFSQFYT